MAIWKSTWSFTPSFFWMLSLLTHHTTVTKIFMQTAGLDYEETFAPVTRLNSLRLLLSLVADFNWNIHHINIKSAYLNGHLNEELYMDQQDVSGTSTCSAALWITATRNLAQAMFQSLLSIMKGGTEQWLFWSMLTTSSSLAHSPILQTRRLSSVCITNLGILEKSSSFSACTSLVTTQRKSSL